ncbi:expressed unknown protein [Seminavis robusta]|uniref:Uncharacterized protein n=1 Tax=Seminavis robusta TaxID=568900 RepID=A0A9N8D7C8_9STRA|nr:expressed unknown protein [Seminavis robusta]|eukprot:Sro25_g017060.1 n/a (134) ;mRNA; f:103363-103764
MADPSPSGQLKHSLMAGTTKVELMEGENWFNMMYGVFHEERGSTNPTRGDTDICFDVHASYCVVKNHSMCNDLYLKKAGPENEDREFRQVPRLQIRSLCPNDCIRVTFPEGEDLCIVQEQTLIYRQEERGSSG